MKLSDNLKKIRKENNLSQEDLAEKIGVSRQSVSKWESGSAYPEMDKMVQICNMFNINIDDLLNQDIGEVNNNKQSKINLNKYINEFLNYITKAVNMFSDMNTKSKIKCIFEQCIIIGVLALIFTIIGSILGQISGNLFSFMNYNIYLPIYNIFKAIYTVAMFILAFAIILHIFKTRYLDYYEEKEVVVVEEKIEEEKVDKKIKENNEVKKEKIIIRDPKHSEYKFINGLVKTFLFGIKMIAAFIALAFCFTLIAFAICLVISFLFVETGLIFIGTLLIILAAIGLNYVVLRVLYGFIFNHKTQKILVGIISFISIFLIGIGIGLIVIGIPEFELIDVDNNNYFENTEIKVKMTDDLVIDGYNISFVESKTDDIKIVITSSKYANIIRDHSHKNNIYIYHQEYNDKGIMDMIRDNIETINDKKIVLFDEYKITVYANKNNIHKIQDNVANYYNDREEIYYQEEINYYQNRIEELETELEAKNDTILVD